VITRYCLVDNILFSALVRLMSGTFKSRKGRITTVISDSTLTNTVNVNTVSNFNCSMYNSIRPSVFVRDTQSVITSNKAFTGSSIVYQTGSLFSLTTPTKLVFPVNGVYTLTHVSSSTALILTTLTLNTVMTITGGPTGTVSTQNIGSATLSANTALSSCWSGYMLAGSSATFTTTSSLPSTYTGLNTLQATLVHWL
jgi:hypothetical protein